MLKVIHSVSAKTCNSAATSVKRLKRILGKGGKSMCFYFETDMAKITQPCSKVRLKFKSEKVLL